MNYKEKYNEALARAKEQLNGAKVFNYDNEQIAHNIRTTVYNIFPELKESEDEKMRKSIIYALRNGGFYDNDKTDEAIVWLEKQGEQKPSWSEEDEIAFLDALWCCKKVASIAKDENEMGTVWCAERWLKSLKERYIWKPSEKQGEQKPVDKVEPKFKVGDWVVYNRNDHSREVIQIYDIRDNRYYFNDNIHFSWSVKECNEKSHLWTIQDAKDGDVLVASDDSVFIFAWVEGYGCIHHIALANDGVLKINPRLISAWESVRGVKPATKEQRDQLKKAMLKDGYKWDADKRELIKL